VSSSNNPLKIGIVTQARVGSTRLPGKTLKVVGGRTLLEHHLRRLKESKLPVHLATTHEKDADRLIKVAESEGVPAIRGSLDDVLSRFQLCAESAGLDVVVRVTSDCPLIDGEMIGRAMKVFLALPDWRNSYLSNTRDRKMPRGFDFEIFSADALKEAFDQARISFEREHVTPFIYKFGRKVVEFNDAISNVDRSSFRITVDTPADLEVIRILIEDHGADQLNASGICALLDAHPEILRINAEVVQKRE